MLIAPSNLACCCSLCGAVSAAPFLVAERGFVNSSLRGHPKAHCCMNAPTHSALVQHDLFLKFPIAVVTQMSAKERKRKHAKECKRVLLRKKCKATRFEKPRFGHSQLLPLSLNPVGSHPTVSKPVWHIAVPCCRYAFFQFLGGALASLVFRSVACSRLVLPLQSVMLRNDSVLAKWPSL